MPRRGGAELQKSDGLWKWLATMLVDSQYTDPVLRGLQSPLEREETEAYALAVLVELVAFLTQRSVHTRCRADDLPHRASRSAWTDQVKYS